VQRNSNALSLLNLFWNVLFDTYCLVLTFILQILCFTYLGSDCKGTELALICLFPSFQTPFLKYLPCSCCLVCTTTPCHPDMIIYLIIIFKKCFPPRLDSLSHKTLKLLARDGKEGDQACTPYFYLTYTWGNARDQGAQTGI